MSQFTTTIDTGSSDVTSRDEEDGLVALMIAWSAEEGDRAGEVALFEAEGSALVLGRGEGEGGRVVFCRQRPGLNDRRPPLASPGISREQLRIRLRHGKLEIEQIGRCPLIVKGEPVKRATIAPGESLLLKRQLLLHCTTRPRRLAPFRGALADLPVFGEPDAQGITGESPAAWRLRDQIAWLGRADEHTLILGPSGSGKELAARAIHAGSTRALKPFVARNAATIPAGLVEAELFGNIKGYPNPGMPERSGLVGAANKGTLFLDEIGELPVALQASLLRVLDQGGEYHPLGGASVMRSNFRLIGATNRDASALKHDLAARLVLRLELPDLRARRDDVPLLARHLLRRAAEKSPAALERFVEKSGPRAGEVRVKPSLVEQLLQIRFSTNVRGLDAVLWRAVSLSEGDAVEGSPALADAIAGEPAAAGEDRETPIGARPPPTEEEIKNALAAAGGSITRAAEALGLPSRYALYRLMKKLGIDGGDARGGG
ncbi:MAG: sigma 54-interacting transcriptional regulator [Byssovorax sp.]